MMASRKFPVDNVLGKCYDIDFGLSRRNLAVMTVRRSMPAVDSELLSLIRWQLFSELSF